MSDEGGRSVRAVILAGGKGVRLRPFTASFPKPLVPLGDVPILEVLIERLIAFGITEITLALGHLSELIKAYFSHRNSLASRIKLDWVEEESPTGTAGSLANVPDLTSTFLVMNGDVLTDLDFRELIAFHRRNQAVLTIASHRRTVQIDLGVMEFDNDDVVRNYIEKPQMDYWVSMGIYVYEPRVLQYIDRGGYLDFPDLVRRLIAAGERVNAMRCECQWLDIGRPDDYALAQELVASKAEVK